MTSLFRRLYPFYLLWIEGWRDFLAGLPFLKRARAYVSTDGGVQTWVNGRWSAGQGAVEGQLLDARKVLLRRLNLPVLTPSQVHTAVEAEVLVSSPFPAESTASGFSSQLTERGQLAVEVAIFHRRELASLQPNLSVFAPGALGPIPIHVSRAQFSTRLTLGLWLCVVALVVVMVMVPLLNLRQQTILHIQAFDRLQKSTAQLQNQREVLQQQFAQHEQLVALQDIHPDPLLALDRVSAALPDTSHLVLFTLKARQINLEGQTPNALTLLNQLQSAPGFAAVQLSGAVQRHPQTGKDIFQMQMRVQP